MTQPYEPMLRTEEELDAFFRADGPVRVLPIDRGKSRNEMPTADELSESQFVAAVARLHEDTTLYPQFPWPDLASVTGPMCPEDLIIIAARTGGGKSLFLQNLFDRLVRDGLYGLYVGLEQGPDILRDKWACLCAGIPPKLVLAATKEQRHSAEWDRAMELVQQQLKWQRTPEIKARAHFAATRKINAAKLRQWVEWAVDAGCQFVIVDHVDRIHHGNGQNQFYEISETIRLAKELAVQHRIVMLLASQVGRPGDAMEQFMPPALHNMRGAGTKEEEADTVLGIYRPLRANVTDDLLKKVRQGLRPKEDAIEPNVMGVMLLKHRLDGPASGKIVKLGVRHQRVMPLADMQEMHRPSQRDWTDA